MANYLHRNYLHEMHFHFPSHLHSADNLLHHSGRSTVRDPAEGRKTGAQVEGALPSFLLPRLHLTQLGLTIFLRKSRWLTCNPHRVSLVEWWEECSRARPQTGVPPSFCWAGSQDGSIALELVFLELSVDEASLSHTRGFVFWIKTARGITIKGKN